MEVADVSMHDATVSAVTSTGTTPALLVLAMGSGALAALVVVSLMSARWPALTTPLVVSLVSVVVWGGTGFWVLHNAQRHRVALRRGFGLGAWLWLGLRLLHEPTVQAGSGGASNAPEGLLGLAAQLADPLALIMVWVCAFCYALLWVVSRPPRRARVAVQRETSVGPSIQK
ncbi:MAG: hypothetical protein DHS20C15_10690 [Planctomycetota bacterium]|nr:MAG: hypothetical protein DHS20C15_10690 [Planctomycetota bacterium]